MASKEDEARVARIRAVIDVIQGKASNNPGIKEAYVPAALVAFFMDELRAQFTELAELMKKEEP